MFSLIGSNNVTNTVIEAVRGINGSGWNVAKMEIVEQVFIVIDLRIPVSFISHDNLFKIQEFILSGIVLTNIRYTMTENDRNVKTIRMFHHSLTTAGSWGVRNHNDVSFHLDTQMDGALLFRNIRIIMQDAKIRTCIGTDHSAKCC